MATAATDTGSERHETDTRPKHDEAGTVLIFAPDGRNADLIRTVLHGEGLASHGCEDAADFAAWLRDRGHEVAAVVVTHRARALGADAAVERFQRAEPSWSALPVLLLTDAGPRTRPPWRNVVQIPQPTTGRHLLDVLGIALDGRVRQRALAAANRQLRRMAFHDPLTGLPNRAALFERLEELRGGSRGAEDGYSILFLDADHFKSVNDRYGHVAGDELLRTIARTIEGAARASDFVARLAGDEFVVVVAGPDSAARAAVVADRLSEETTVHLDQADADVVLSLSVGTLDVTADDDPDDVIARADARMYEHKLSKASLVATDAARRA